MLFEQMSRSYLEEEMQEKMYDAKLLCVHYIRPSHVKSCGYVCVCVHMKILLIVTTLLCCKYPSQFALPCSSLTNHTKHFCARCFKEF